MSTQTKTKTPAELRAELEATRATLRQAAARADALEAAGVADDASIDELARLTAKRTLLVGAAKRIEAEIPRAERAEAQAEIARLAEIVKKETATGEAAADKLAAAACKLLVPEPDSHRIWTHQYCERRRHEIGQFAKEHPTARCHLDEALAARLKIADINRTLAG